MAILPVCGGGEGFLGNGRDRTNACFSCPLLVLILFSTPSQENVQPVPLQFNSLQGLQGVVCLPSSSISLAAGLALALFLA